MFFIYQIVAVLASKIVVLLAFFSPKMKLFVDGRKNVWQQINTHIAPSDRTIWVHAASLGEYEQGLPIMEGLMQQFPNHKLVLTFFSPSGFEVRKNNHLAHLTLYLPLDTLSNAQKFVQLVHPEMAFFIKYEFWPHYLQQLQAHHVKTYLISGIFRKNQVFFKWYGGFYRQALQAFDHFFVQNESAKTLLQQMGFQNSTVSGDTRFDRVVTILEQDNTLDFIEKFTNQQTTIVMGSTWKKDEELLVAYLNQAPQNIKFIIAPHQIKPEQIAYLQASITKKNILFSNKNQHDLSNYDVFIVDTIGILTKIYQYANIAYVGGGFGHPGVHNILEPATFGVPIVIGPHYSHFAEATALVQMGGCVTIQDAATLKEAFDLLLQNDDVRHEKGYICHTFVQMNKGATALVLAKIKSFFTK
ncbi:3-deoxy-D-manno-octulosonic acid transferase [Flavobacterium branchiophilum NBRC 15030 = ATCC 35035]|uniref:3-deoxy-D-manno-octulosonic acid transferase n=1 Tax=Flavobacterium branchiophilum TaxID=55197 RepID=A0A543G4I4_9FLAO|nr:glycosyltransferase N-terminal domain-containing protein [Flavobacterium branchiophilum]OXA75350.1 3-deoxy-D-manno-octulosonic acid transferase [Flavobacterium branchiophilum NBRC 15030 = ATCC 35035]TQM40934.1 3-deoxy-D-manno-octulosonic-acid transferase [Flavobacterium branchiophilum]GEM54745.1 3-deoxy-D-manno-octulosonic acid transferase [Flavobacterium branchiophilum NBRC 15030 = ATCC 35035]